MTKQHLTTLKIYILDNWNLSGKHLSRWELHLYHFKFFKWKTLFLNCGTFWVLEHLNKSFKELTFTDWKEKTIFESSNSNSKQDLYCKNVESPEKVNVTWDIFLQTQNGLFYDVNMGSSLHEARIDNPSIRNLKN